MKPSIAVIFDMDGVLLDTERLMMDCFRLALEDLHEPFRQEVYLETLGVSDVDTLAVYAAHYGGQERAREIFQRFVERTGERLRTGGVPVKAGAAELLAFLQKRGAALGLASSNRRAIVEWELGQAGLLHHFQVLVCGDEVAKSKPDPEIYARAFRLLERPEAQGYAVEDAPAGIAAARGAGLRPILIPDLLAPGPATAAPAHKVLGSLAEAQGYFASIL